MFSAMPEWSFHYWLWASSLHFKLLPVPLCLPLNR